jgi:hypothetical protein
MYLFELDSNSSENSDVDEQKILDFYGGEKFFNRMRNQ